MPDSTYPEHEKLQRVKRDSHVIGEFIEAMQGQGVQLCRLRQFTEEREVYRLPDGTLTTSSFIAGFNDGEATGERQDVPVGDPEFRPVRESINEVLAGYFGIDYRALMAEKDRMLEDVRAANRAREEG